MKSLQGAWGLEQGSLLALGQCQALPATAEPSGSSGNRRPGSRLCSVDKRLCDPERSSEGLCRAGPRVSDECSSTEPWAAFLRFSGIFCSNLCSVRNPWDSGVYTGGWESWLMCVLSLAISSPPFLPAVGSQLPAPLTPSPCTTTGTSTALLFWVWGQ